MVILVGQFTQDVSNQRTGSWGGSIADRSRFGSEVTKAIVEAIGAEKVGYRTSPFSDFWAMRMENPESQFKHPVTELAKL